MPNSEDVMCFPAKHSLCMPTASSMMMFRHQVFSSNRDVRVALILTVQDLMNSSIFRNVDSIWYVYQTVVYELFEGKCSRSFSSSTMRN